MKEKLTDHAIRLFDEKGFTVTSIQDIVESIGVTKGTFYYYYSSKEELLREIHIRYINELLSKQESILKDDGKSYREKLFDIVHLSIVDIKEQGSSAKVFFREIRHLSQESLEIIEPKRDMYRYNIEALLDDGKRKGDFRKDFDVSIVTFGILGMMNWSYQWYKPDGSKSGREIAGTFVEMILRGIEEG
ncbi:TetR/AcrR family transcriptional regulator (plasmid) [Cytobacillus spongiae]|uniref:TetR/AcrR family transcriptional regulator n=1 Tax=Cytobacillus spongiae TaxID=2901381 RepID=UPI00145F37C7|nr:TetR/AcrR family transcriptional regulator [Cytobacillus spongiae]MCA1062811.1 TetR/AcrR family transcriptional regulator [Rossellomorea aquimaris]NMH70144.1 TetR/AcrR family transcriptional regulator [Bacillus sp. RO3]UII58423.1 TetR/AcrR family transcriptional regulator [Cytobacillus spongiae]